MVSVILQHAGTCTRLGLLTRNVYATFNQTNRYLISSPVTNMGDRVEKAKLSRVEKYYCPLAGSLKSI